MLTAQLHSRSRHPLSRYSSFTLAGADLGCAKRNRRI